MRLSTSFYATSFCAPRVTPATIFTFMTTCVLIASALLTSPHAQALTDITYFPSDLPSQCNDIQPTLYNECGDQVSILNAAIAQAQQERKSVLVIYGGEWCSWCHVLNNHFEGKFRTQNHQWRIGDENIEQWSLRQRISQQDVADAVGLHQYIADNFIVTYIDSVYTNGAQAIDSTNFDSNLIEYSPFIIALNSEGEYVDYIAATDAMESLMSKGSANQEFKGYNRKVLLDQLKYLKSRAS